MERDLRATLSLKKNKMRFLSTYLFIAGKQNTDESWIANAALYLAKQLSHRSNTLSSQFSQCSICILYVLVRYVQVFILLSSSQWEAVLRSKYLNSSVLPLFRLLRWWWRLSCVYVCFWDHCLFYACSNYI